MALPKVPLHGGIVMDDWYLDDKRKQYVNRWDSSIVIDIAAASVQGLNLVNAADLNSWLNAIAKHMKRKL
jgi:fructosamine-3-kinase